MRFVPRFPRLRLRERYRTWSRRGRVIFWTGCLAGLGSFAFGGRSAATYSETTSFCTSCHEMEQFEVTMRRTAHEKLQCGECHIGPGLKGFLVAKYEGAGDLYHHLRGDYDPKDLRISALNWGITNRRCDKCHSKGNTKSAEHLPNTRKAHFAHKGDGTPAPHLDCTLCHIGLVHFHGDLESFQSYLKPRPERPDEEYDEPKCYACHTVATPGVVTDWLRSEHSEKGVTCIACHGGDHAAINKTHGQVSAGTCGGCHEKEHKQFLSSAHARGFDDGLAAAKKLGLTEAARRERCDTCHRIGRRFESDESVGECNACHTRHAFSSAEARRPESCTVCHSVPDDPQHDIFEASVHGILYRKATATTPPAKRGAACADCHGFAHTHDVSEAVAHNLDGTDRPPDKAAPARAAMTANCKACHSEVFSRTHLAQADAAVGRHRTVMDRIRSAAAPPPAGLPANPHAWAAESSPPAVQCLAEAERRAYPSAWKAAVHFCPRLEEAEGTMRLEQIESRMRPR